MVFLLTCLLRGMTMNQPKKRIGRTFLLTCLSRGMTNINREIPEYTFVSTHMPLARHDVLLLCQLQCGAFLLTCLLRGMTISGSTGNNGRWFLLTCLLRGMTPSAGFSETRPDVSTHMPLARHDMGGANKAQYFLFLLTCLLRGMTSPSPS